jgi:hypothetical protein
MAGTDCGFAQGAPVQRAPDGSMGEARGTGRGCEACNEAALGRTEPHGLPSASPPWKMRRRWRCNRSGARAADRHGEGAGLRQADYWQQSADAAYLPVQIRSPTREQFNARCGASSGRWASSASRSRTRWCAIRARSPPAIRSVCTFRSSPRADQRRPGRTDGRCTHGRHHQLRHVVPGRLPSRPTVRVVHRQDPALAARPPRGRDRQQTAMAISGVNGLRAPRWRSSGVWRTASGTARSRRRTRPTWSTSFSISCAVCTHPASVPERTSLRSRSGSCSTSSQSRPISRSCSRAGGDRASHVVSTRCLHKLFESEGTTVCRWIRASRPSVAAGTYARPGPRRRDDSRDREPLGSSGRSISAALPLQYGCAPRHRREGRNAVA